LKEEESDEWTFGGNNKAKRLFPVLRVPGEMGRILNTFLE